MVSRDWITIPLGKVATLQRGYDLPNRLRRLGEVPIVTSSGIGGTHNEAIVSGPGVITGRYGTIGEVFYVESEFWPLNTTLFVQDFHGNDPLFVSYLLRTIDFQTHSGKSGVPGVNRNDLHEVVVSLPPTKTEQEAIAEVLSDADALIESLEQLIAKKHQIKHGAMQELLTGKKRLPGFETKPGYKQTDVGAIPEDWDSPELGDLLKSMQLGGNYKNSDRETNWPLIKMGNLGRGSIKLDKLEFINSVQGPSSRDRLEDDDVLLNTRNTLDLVGKVAIWRNELPEAYFNSNIMRTKFDEQRVSSYHFMNYILNTSRSLRGLRGIAIGTTSVAGIYSRDLVKLKIPLPTKAEQTAIATILSDMDAEIAALEEKLAKARQLKQGMMQELLTGKTRLMESEK